MGRHGATCTGEVRVLRLLWSFMLSYLLGKKVSERDERIPGGLKYRWAPGTSAVGPGQLTAISKTTT